MKQYNVTGMSCAACSARVEKAVSQVEGVTSCSVSLLTNSMGVEGTATPESIIAAVEKAGYGATQKESRKTDASKQNQDEDYYRQVYIPDTLDRATINYLPHSKSEVESIKKLLRNKQISATVLSGKKGTELSFKTISKNSPSIIHIATHGFYHKSKEGIDYDDYESGMLRSGLVMSSGGSAFIGETKDLYDDGLLLADEIAHLNLEKTDLVVLSACETALGDPTTEGLIGLLRGFKLAGAQTLVMSLWPVNDFVTNELMTDFYTYLCDGKSKREAFYKAVDNCRIKYQHPRLWAPFVMID